MSKRFYLLCAVVLLVGVLVVCPSLNLHAQVFSPPAPQSSAGTSQAGVVPTGAAQVGVQQAGGAVVAPRAGEVEQTGWAGIPLPKLTMPTLTMPKLTMPSMASVTAPMKSGFSKVSSGTKKAWQGTKEIFSFGQSSSAAAPAVRASNQQKTTFWQRLTARPAEPQGPQTVGEFMKQPRLDP